MAERNGKQVTQTWSRLSTQLGQRVTLSCNRKRFTGNCIGVDPEKGLILQLDRGGIRMFDAAHTSVVKATEDAIINSRASAEARFHLYAGSTGRTR